MSPLSSDRAAGDALLAAIVATSDDAIISKWLDGRIVTWNAGAERLLGWTAEEAIGRGITMIIPADRLGEEADVIARITAGEHIRHYETVRLRKDGQPIDVSLSISPVCDERGRAFMAAAILRDVTRERAAAARQEQALDAEREARAEAERMQGLLEEQAIELENQAAELEATIDEAQRAARMLDAVLDQLPVGVFVAEAPSARILFRNRKADELVGPPGPGPDASSAYARYSVERSDGTSYPTDARPLARALRDHETVDREEMFVRRPDGGLIELAVSASPVRDADGEVTMAVSIVSDVTDRNAARRASAEQEALLHAYFSAPGLMMLVLELELAGSAPDFRIVLANDAARAWIGPDAETLVGKLASSWLPSEAGIRMTRLFADVHASGRPSTIEMPSSARANAWLRMSVSPIAPRAGGPPRIGLLMTDVSEERAREEERRRLHRLVEHATDFIAVASMSLELEYVNPAGLALVGAPGMDAVRGRSALDMFALESRFRLESEILPMLQATGSWSGESLMRQMETGELVPVELALFTLSDPVTGAPVAIATVGRAVGERQKLQAELRQAQKMEAVGQLAGGIAHDFNNLLSIILSYSMMVSESLPPGDRTRADVDEIRLAGERAAALTRQLLAFSRQQVLQPQIVDLNDVIAGTEKMLRRLIGEDIELLTAPARGLGDVLVDPGQIEQVIMNLAVNARDAMPDGGKITIETANVDLDESFTADREGLQPGPHVLLAVTDTGEGMDAATMAHIFEPFFTTKGPGKGTGLGLSTVFGIVKQSGGSIRAYSEPGSGTSMQVYLPRHDRAGIASPPPTFADIAESGGSETILLVEDELQVRLVAATILRRYGYHVLDAGSGGDALVISEQHSATIHLLLTDVIMQRMSGPTLAERLSRTRPEMKVLFMSGYTDRAIINHALLDSNRSFIQKPFTPERLGQKIRQLLDAPSRGTTRTPVPS